MGDCDICEGDENFKYSCPRCGGTYCSDHRQPEAHDCDGGLIGDYKTQRSGPEAMEVKTAVGKRPDGDFGDPSPGVSVDGSIDYGDDAPEDSHKSVQNPGLLSKMIDTLSFWK